MPHPTAQDRTAVFTPQGPPITLSMGSMPWIPGLFAKLLVLSGFRPSNLASDTVLKNAEIRYDNYRMDPRTLASYRRVCGYPADDSAVPAPFVQTLFIGMVAKFIGTGVFPITPMGLIQVGQSFEVFGPISSRTRLDLSCRLVDMTRTDRGIHTRMRMEARAAGSRPSSAPLWQGTSLYFTRAKHPGPKTRKAIKEPPLPVQETIEIPENTGRQYAAASGDYNPHHLYGWTAKPMGFKQPIAHGMWSLARACASLEKALGRPAAYRVEGRFKLPVFMPARVTLGYQRQGDGEASGNAGAGQETVAFEIRDEKQGLPHLKGHFHF